MHQYGGAWRKDLDLNINILAFDGKDAVQGETEVDVMLEKPLGNGLYGWIGYGRDDEDREVGYLQSTLFF